MCVLDVKNCFPCLIVVHFLVCLAMSWFQQKRRIFYSPVSCLLFFLSENTKCILKLFFDLLSMHINI